MAGAPPADRTEVRTLASFALLAGALVSLSLALPGPAAATACANAELQPDGRNAALLKKAVLCLLDEERAHRGLRPLREHARLLKAARHHSADMIRRGYFAHTSPDGESMKDRAVAARYVPRRGRWRVAENIGWGAGPSGTPQRIVTRWMRSRSHRRNIVDGSLRHVGLGVVDAAPDGGDGATFTLLLGRR